jgi:superfamily II DNA/RNA helicase
VQCPPKGKAEFLEEVFKTLEMTQSIIFVNTRDFVLTLRNILRKKGCRTNVMFGEMENEERDI